MAIYMKIAGISGSVSTKGFQNTIELFSLQQINQRPVQQVAGMGENREKGSLVMQHMQVSKGFDAASPMLYDHFCSGKAIPEVTIYQCFHSGQHPDWQIQYTLHNVIISGFNEAATSRGHHESLTLAFTKIEKGYRQQNSAGQLQSPAYTGYDLAQASKL